MARITTSELLDLIKELQTQVGDLKTQLGITKLLIDRVNLLAQIERLAKIETELKELNRRKEEGERRNWQLIGIGFGAVLSLLGGIIVQLVVLGVRK
jgi:hypothetical protein